MKQRKKKKKEGKAEKCCVGAAEILDRKATDSLTDLVKSE